MKKSLSCSVFFLLCLSSYCQENNYWSTQYGAKSNLLGGASVASFIDDGAIYYNPGTLAFKDSTHISVSANAFQMEILKVKNGMGQGLDLESQNYDVAPQLVGGNKKLSKKIEFEFILLSRYIVNAQLQAVHKIDDVPLFGKDSTELFRFTGEFETRNKVQEQWGGAAISYRLSKNIGIGITNFVAYRFQKNSQGVNATAVPNTSGQFYIMKLDFTRGLTYYTVRDIVKAGISYNGNKFAAGCAFTFPSIHITGSGTADNYFYIANLPDKNFIGFNQYNKGENIKPQYKSPWSVSTGLSFKSEKIKIHIAAEYFGKVPWYALYQPQPGTSLIPGPMGIMHKSDTLFSVRKGANAVLNASAGTEIYLSPVISLLAGFRTDFTCRNYNFNSINDNVFSESGFDIWHYSLGLTYSKNKTTVTSGFTYSFGKSEARQQPVNFRRPDNVSYLLGKPEPSGVITYNKIAFVIGFTF
ncbi:MAG: hypothetical protein IAF38_16765 [Bacteroidia bacterium]|nr:hypothetical protein [Bacteroidia bacterium]